jgi:homoserine O-succinyltransferase
MGSHESKNAPPGHLEKFYINAEEIIFLNVLFDGLIITGAPVETLPFEEVDYWDELVRVIDCMRRVHTPPFRALIKGMYPRALGHEDIYLTKTTYPVPSG